MELADKVAVVTGGGNGIGRALCRRFVAEGAHGVVVVDRDADAVRAVADELGDRALGLTADVAVEADIVNVVERTEEHFGPVDLFCSNAGIGGGGGVDAPDEVWNDIWAINLMAHVYAARRAAVDDRERRGLPAQHRVGRGPAHQHRQRAVHDHEARGRRAGRVVGDHVRRQGHQGVVPVPAGREDEHAPQRAGRSVDRGRLAQGAIEPEELAEAVINGLRAETFLILPHPEVADYVRRKADDRDRWITGMRRLQSKIYEKLA